MTRLLLLLAGLLLVAGPIVILLGGGINAGVFVFSAGVVLLGVHGLAEGRDRAAGRVLIFVGVPAILADVVRLLLL